MTDMEFRILSLLNDKAMHTAEETWKLFGMGHWKSTERRIARLVDQGAVSRKKRHAPHLDELSILPDGEEALASEMERRASLQRAADADQRSDSREEELLAIERRRDKRESRHWIWNTVNTIIAAGALVVAIIALFQ